MTDFNDLKDVALLGVQPIDVEITDGFTGEVKTVKATPVSIVQAVELKFKTNFTDNTKTFDCEINDKPYEIDDSMYVPLRDLLKLAEAQKLPIKVVDSFDGLSDKEVIDAVQKEEIQVSVDNSAELSTGTTESPQEASEVVNPVENSTDVPSAAPAAVLPAAIAAAAN